MTLCEIAHFAQIAIGELVETAEIIAIEYVPYEVELNWQIAIQLTERIELLLYNRLAGVGSRAA